MHLTDLKHVPLACRPVFRLISMIWCQLKTAKWSHARVYLANQSSPKLVFILMVTFLTLKLSDLKLSKLWFDAEFFMMVQQFWNDQYLHIKRWGWGQQQDK